MAQLKETLHNDSWLDQIQGVLQDNISVLFEKVFNSIQSTLYDGVAYSVLSSVVLIWLLGRLKTGYPTRDDTFKAAKWIISVCFVYGVFYSYDSYAGFISLFNIPAAWVRAGIAGIFDTSGESFGEIVTNAINVIDTIKEKLFEVGFEKNDTSVAVPEVFINIATFFGMFWFWVFYVVFWLVMIGIIAIVLSSTFIALLILAMAPMVIPFLTIRTLIPYFFSWLKLFISYSLYAPLAFVVLNIAMLPIAKANSLIEQGKIDIIYDNQIQYFLVPIAISILCIYLFKQIPNWISQILGVQGLQAGGTGSAVTSMAQTGMMAASAGAGAVAAKSIGQSAAMGALKGAGQSLPFGKSIGEAFSNIGKNVETSGRGINITP